MCSSDLPAAYVRAALDVLGVRRIDHGVRCTEDPDLVARLAAEQILGMQLVTHQTGPEGQVVKSVMVEAASDIEREFYLGITLDRAQSKIVVMASTEGGMEIEEVAEATPEKILRIDIDPAEMTHWTPDAGVVGDSKTSLRALIDALKTRRPAANNQRANISAAKQKIAGELEAVQPQMSYLNAIREIGRAHV